MRCVIQPNSRESVYTIVTMLIKLKAIKIDDYDTEEALKMLGDPYFRKARMYL